MPYVWDVTLDLGISPYLKDHCLQQSVVVPGSVYLELARAALAAVHGTRSCLLETVAFQRLCFLSEGRPQRLQAVLVPDDASGWSFYVQPVSPDGLGAAETSLARLMVAAERPDDEYGAPAYTLVSLPAAQHRCTVEQEGVAFYATLQQHGNAYGPAFQAIARLWRGEGEAVATLTIPDVIRGEEGAYIVHPALMDAVTQVLAATEPHMPGSMVLVGCDRVHTSLSPGVPHWVYAQRRSEKDDAADLLVGDLQVWDALGQRMLYMEGVRFKYLAQPPQRDPARTQPAHTIALTATFTAEPLKEALAFWMETLHIPATLAFAPYNQPFQQLLHPDSLLSQNREGMNVVLVRFEDWMHQKHLALQVDGEEQADLLSDRQRHTLPNGLEIVHLNPYETEYLYREIFSEQRYLKHGITLRDKACVVDVGANIGLFTLFVQHVCQEAQVYAFEPSPPAFDALRANVRRYGSNVQVFNCGLADRNGEAPFTYYPRSSVFSGYHADVRENQQALHAAIQNMLHQQYSSDPALVENLVATWTADRFAQETFYGPLKTLSSVIREQSIEVIDLLKIDAEKSELAILRGIEAAHWERIRQVVMEVHDPEGDALEAVVALLAAHGFVTEVAEETLLQGTGLHMVYARQQPAMSAPVASSSSPSGATAAWVQHVDDLVEAVHTAQQHTPVPYLVCLCPASPWVHRDPVARSLHLQMERRLVEKLKALPRVHVIVPTDVRRYYPVADYNDSQADQQGHIPYTPLFYTTLATLIARRYHACWRSPYKVIVLDCDQTLWSGICGEDGAQGVVVDRSRQHLQAFMAAQHDQGMLLCLCSKNNEEDVWAVFEHHPQMILRRDQVAAWRINWQPKPENIQALAEELRLGLDSFIFIDDDPVACAEMLAHCPEVLTLHLPAEAAAIPRFLDHVWAFDHLEVTDTDRQRTRLYLEDRQREASRQHAMTFASFMEGLGLVVRITEATAQHEARIAQLTQRTNQFNTTTIRRTQAEVHQLLQEASWEGLAVEVSDRFGDYGLVGVLFFQERAEGLHIDTFLLSCRALGRGVEHQMMARLGALALARGIGRIEVPFYPTSKNQPARLFLESIGRAYGVPMPRETDTNRPATSAPGRRFVFPASRVAQLTFDTKAAETSRVPPARHPEETLAHSTARAEMRGRLMHVQVQRIATEWNEAAAIHASIEQHKRQRRPEGAGAFVAPTSTLERTIAELWQEVLGIEQVGLDDRFFEVGGTSLQAIALVSRLQQTFGVALPALSVFDKTTVRALAEMLQGIDGWKQKSAAQQGRGQQRRARYLALQSPRNKR